MTEEPIVPTGGINTFNEKPLHAALKAWYAAPGDRIEARIDGFIIDVVHGDLLIEIQTGSFSALRRKLYKLTEQHSVRLVFPIPIEKWIITQPEEAEAAPGRRKSPSRGRMEQLFRELVHLPALLTRETFSVEVLLIHEEEVRRAQGKKTRWNKGWVKEERRLLAVVERRVFETPADLVALIPDHLAQPFTARELARSVHIPPRLAQQMVYCLRQCGALQYTGMRGKAYLYQKA